MKNVLFLLATTLLSAVLSVSSAFGSTTLEPLQNDEPANGVEFSTKPIIVTLAAGHWVSVDKDNPVAGFVYAEINCFKGGHGYRPVSTCTENSATVAPLVGFQVSVDHNEYEVISWRSDGLTARYVGGSCKIAHTLEIDFKTGGVLVTDSATTTENKHCAEIYAKPSTYRLMKGDNFTVKTK